MIQVNCIKQRKLIQLATFKQYTKKNGEKAWYFKAYLGVNPKTGKKVTTTKRGFRTQREAKIAEARLQTNHSFNTDVKEKPKTYQEVYDAWMIEYEKTVRGSTLLKTKRIFKNHVLDALGDTYISEVTPLKIQELMNEWSNKYTTANKMMNYTGLVFKYAMRFGLINQNPVESILKPKKKANKKTEESFYDKDELKIFLNTLYQYPSLKVQAYFRLLAMTGMRKQEAGALEWRDIDFDTHTVTIDKAVSRTEAGLIIDETKNEGSNRIISADEETLAKLIEWKEEAQPPSDEWLIFGNDKATKSHDIMSLDTSRKWLLTIQDRMDKDSKKRIHRITTHGFRHTHASLLVEMGASLKDIQYRLGHSDIQTTMNIYAHVSKSAKEKLANDFNTFIDF